MRKVLVWVLPLIGGLTACSGTGEESPRRSQMSRRQRDSVIAESNLPGSAVVRKAMQMSDAQAERTAMMDSASQ